MKPSADHAHGPRKPITHAIYNISVSRILSAFRGVLDALDDLQQSLSTRTSVTDPGARLIAAHTELLEAMSSHIEDAFQIMKACHPPRPDIGEPFADRWLERARFRGAAHFKVAVKPYRDVVSALVNRVKHEHGQLRLIAFSNGVVHVPGYYLEAIGSDGVAGQDPALHPGNTAFSFNRDLRLHFIHLYDIGNALKAVLSPALKQQGIRVTGRPIMHSSQELLLVAERVEALGTTVFPDEVRKATPHVRVQEGDDNVSVAVRYPSLATFRLPDPTMIVSTLIQGDGFTSQFRVPYFGRDLGVTMEEGR